MYTANQQSYPCATSLAMHYIGGKWKAVILLHLVEKKRYHQLRKELKMVTERTISLQLKALQEDGLINKKVEGEKAPFKVEYELTALGKTLIPLLEEISKWGKWKADQL